MLNRRILRVKAFKILYSNISSGQGTILDAEKELLYSCARCRDLYLVMLDLSRALRDIDNQVMEARMSKLRPSEEDMNPNRKFSGNMVINMLDDNYEFTKTCAKVQACDEGKGEEEKKARFFDWREHDAFLRRLYRTIVAKDYYAAYIANEERTLAEDCDLLSRIYEEELEDNAELLQILEDASIYWTDDLGYVLGVIVRTLRDVKKGGRITVPSIFTNDATSKDMEDDRTFVIRLVDYAIANYSKLFAMISESTRNWDSDRLVSTDIALIVLGLAEAMAFPTIPVKVTINEYVEISKYYSTANSRLFVNGLLDRLIQKGLEEGKIVKSGKGLL